MWRGYSLRLWVAHGAMVVALVALALASGLLPWWVQGVAAVVVGVLPAVALKRWADPWLWRRLDAERVRVVGVV